jgi:hypothetical protein
MSSDSKECKDGFEKEITKNMLQVAMWMVSITGWHLAVASATGEIGHLYSNCQKTREELTKESIASIRSAISDKLKGEFEELKALMEFESKEAAKRASFMNGPGEEAFFMTAADAEEMEKVVLEKVMDVVSGALDPNGLTMSDIGQLGNIVDGMMGLDSLT